MRLPFGRAIRHASHRVRVPLSGPVLGGADVDQHLAFAGLRALELIDAQTFRTNQLMATDGSHDAVG